MGVEDTNTENNDQPSKPEVANLWSHGPLQGELPLKVTLKDVVAQKADRLLIDALLDYSEEDEDKGLIGTLFCGDWRDAVTGWKLTRPNVKYAWSEKAIKERRHKNVNHTKKKQQEEQTWKNKIEPGTYR